MDAEAVPDEASAPTGRSPVALTAALALSLFGVAVTLLTFAVPDLEPATRRIDPPWWLLAPLFTVSEFFVVHLRVRRSAFTVSFGTVALVLGLGLLDPVGFLLASLLGSGLTLLVHRRQRGLKLLFNSGLWAFEAALAVTLYGLLADGADPASGRAILAAYATIVVTDQLTALALTAVISLHEGRIDRESLREAVTWGLAVAICNTSVGLLVVVLLERQPAAVPLLGIILGVLLVAYRAYRELGTTHSRLEQHHEFAQSIAQAYGTPDVVAQILDGARNLMEAERAELHIAGQVYRSPPPAQDESGQAPPVRPSWLERVHEGAVVLPKARRNPEELALLRHCGATEAAAAPIRVGETTGALVVMDPMGEVASFTPDHLRALETLAHQASVALENGALVDRLRQEAAEREHESLHDSLTGLPNRVGFLREVDAAILRHGEAGVLLLDLDRFKDVNDALGHTVGDELLRVTADQLRGTLPTDVVTARLGGDEFAVLMHGAGAAETIRANAERVIEALGATVVVRDVELHVEVSIGSAVAPLDGRDAEELLQRADVAMYRAKERRSGYESYLASRDRSSSERLALYAELRHAVSGGLLEVHLQPAIVPATGRVAGAEALARWPHPTRGYLPPDEFIPLAERSGLIRPLTMLVLERSLTELVKLRAQGLLDAVSVNISARMLIDTDLPVHVSAALERTGAPAQALTLEVTETSMMQEPDKAAAVLTALDALGVSLSVDDFGTGYSSLAYLKRLPVDEVKIDRSFVTALHSDPDDQAIVRSTIELAHELGLSVVAEGVEDEASLQLLTDWGCDVVQGFLISRPVPPERLAEWVRNRERLRSTQPSIPAQGNRSHVADR